MPYVLDKRSLFVRCKRGRISSRHSLFTFGSRGSKTQPRLFTQPSRTRTPRRNRGPDSVLRGGSIVDLLMEGTINPRTESFSTTKDRTPPNRRKSRVEFVNFPSSCPCLNLPSYSTTTRSFNRVLLAIGLSHDGSCCGTTPPF